jgi:ABC-2 type transport system permease protein
MSDRRPSQVAITLGLTKYALKATLRNRFTLVFGLIFPLGFLVVFGFIGGGTAKIAIGVAPELETSPGTMVLALQMLAAKKDAPITLRSGTKQALEADLKSGDLGAVLEPGAKPGEIQIVTSTANPIASQTASGILRGFTDGINLHAAEAAAGASFSPPVTTSATTIEGKEKRYIDFALPGMIGFALIGLATFGVAFSILTMRKTLVLKRMLATSARPITFVISQCLSRSFQAVLQAAIIILVGMYAFHFTLPHGAETMLEMLVVSFFGVLSFLGFGLFLANLAKDEQMAPLLLNAFTLPQFLLGGVFFPSSVFPGWLQVIANNLPLSYLTTALRMISADGRHLVDVLPQLGGLLAWSILAYVAAAKTFRVEP